MNDKETLKDIFSKAKIEILTEEEDYLEIFTRGYNIVSFTFDKDGKLTKIFAWHFVFPHV